MYLPYNALHNHSYFSISRSTSVCARPAAAGLDEHSGSGVNHQKKECGIHVTLQEESIVSYQSDGFTLWLTGLSGAGKTTIAVELERLLRAAGRRVERLDGDTVREV